MIQSGLGHRKSPDNPTGEREARKCRHLDVSRLAPARVKMSLHPVQVKHSVTAQCRYRGCIGVVRRAAILYSRKTARRSEKATGWTRLAQSATFTVDGARQHFPSYPSYALISFSQRSDPLLAYYNSSLGHLRTDRRRRVLNATGTTRR
jgi:hypothetical protein